MLAIVSLFQALAIVLLITHEFIRRRWVKRMTVRYLAVAPAGFSFTLCPEDEARLTRDIAALQPGQALHVRLEGVIDAPRSPSERHPTDQAE